MLTLDTMLAEQEEKDMIWTPSKVIARLGVEINNEHLIYYGAEKNNILVLSPTLSDGNLHFYRNSGLIIDIISDLNL
ncbi:deoxyhypusine synthase-like [Bombus affinis]|uniref:deoxyhypusine synthase-like n=1 Tax=Bombus affinis TaxID=309941 RepID=UPI0021B71355|nr:deoxyhypusine synthase-like [Bombus affinis]